MVSSETEHRTVVTGNRLGPTHHCATNSKIVLDAQIPGKPRDGRTFGVEDGNGEGTTRGVATLIGGKVTD